MPSNLVFTAEDGGVDISGNFESGIDELWSPAGSYQVAKIGTYIQLIPLNNAYPIPKFTAAQVTTPASGGNINTLKSLLQNLFETTDTNSESMTPNGTLYVSTAFGNDTNSGALNSPKKTIAAAATLANFNATANGSRPWTVHVLAGAYDEQIAPTSNLTRFVFDGGAALLYSGGSSAITDASGEVHITLLEGAKLLNMAGGTLFSIGASSNNILIGGTIDDAGTGSLPFAVTAGSIEIRDCRIEGSSASGLLTINGGTAKLVNCQVLQGHATAAFVKDGGTLHLTRCGIQQSAGNYITTSGAESVQIVDCVTNLAAGAGITETVGTMLVNAAYTL